MAIDPFSALTTGLRQNTDATNNFIAAVARLGGTSGVVTMFVKSAVSVYSDYEETLNRFTAAFRSRHQEMMDIGERFAKSYGESSTTAIRMLSDSAVVLRNLGFSSNEVEGLSQRINVLASDLTSFRDVAKGATYVNQQLMAGMMGHTRQLLHLGIAIRQREPEWERYVRQIQRAEGTTYAKARAIAVLEESLRQSAIAEGDYARNSESLSNTQRRLTAAFIELQKQVGSDFAPVVKDATELLTNAVRAFSDLDPAIRRNIAAIGVYVAAWGTASFVFKGLLPFLAGFKTVVTAAGAAAGGAAIGPTTLSKGMDTLKSSSAKTAEALTLSDKAVDSLAASMPGLATHLAAAATSMDKMAASSLTTSKALNSLQRSSAETALYTQYSTVTLDKDLEAVLDGLRLSDDRLVTDLLNEGQYRRVLNQNKSKIMSAAEEVLDKAGNKDYFNDLVAYMTNPKSHLDPPAEFREYRAQLQEVLELGKGNMVSELQRFGVSGEDVAVMADKVSDATTKTAKALKAATKTAKAAAVKAYKHSSDAADKAAEIAGVRIGPAAARRANERAYHNVTLSTITPAAARLANKRAAQQVATLGIASSAKAVAGTVGKFVSALLGPAGMITGLVATLIYANKDKIAGYLFKGDTQAARLDENVSKSLDAILEQRRQGMDEFKSFVKDIRAIQQEEIAFLTDNLPATLRLGALRQRLNALNKDINAYAGTEATMANIKRAQAAYTKAGAEKARIEKRLAEIDLAEEAYNNILPGDLSFGPATPESMGGKTITQLVSERKALTERLAEVSATYDRELDRERQLLSTTEDIKALRTQRLQLLRERITMESAQEAAERRLVDVQTSRALYGKSSAAKYAQALKEASETTNQLNRAQSLPLRKYDPKRFGFLMEAVDINRRSIMESALESMTTLRALPITGRAKELIDRATSVEQIMTTLDTAGSFIARQSPEAAKAIDTYTKALKANLPEIEAILATANTTLAKADTEGYAELLQKQLQATEDVRTAREAMLREIDDSRRAYVEWFTDRAPMVAIKAAGQGLRQSIRSVLTALKESDYQQASTQFQSAVNWFERTQRIQSERREEYRELSKQSFRQTSTTGVEVGSQEALRLRSRAIDSNPAAAQAARMAASIDSRLEQTNRFLDRLASTIYDGALKTTVENGVAL